MKAETKIEAAVAYFASRSHNAWRRKFHQDHPKEKRLPRMRMRGGALVDINQPWSRLDARAQKDNLVAARAAHKALSLHPKDREAAAAYVHARWVARNRRDPNQPKELFRAYRDLPEIEKDKDRAHIDRMKAAIAAVKKSARKATKGKKAAKPAKAARRPAAAPKPSARKPTRRKPSGRKRVAVRKPGSARKRVKARRRA
ncbi:MAG: hypothetical protein JNJ73_04110 [Hyphomonadaceae bacterium]|nr:hypothetical protein [Hyphomonadaceae bacterium]